MNPEEVQSVHELLREEPLRDDEFIFLSAEVFEIEKHYFKSEYPKPNLKNLRGELSMADFPETINIMVSPSVEIGFEYKNKKRVALSVWLGDKKLGIIKERHSKRINTLFNSSKVSRVALIANPDSIAGFYDTYMKVVFIVTNSENVRVSYDKGRFKSLELLTEEEIEELENPVFEDN